MDPIQANAEAFQAAQIEKARRDPEGGMKMSTGQQETPRDAILRVARELGLSMRADFVPFSQSRNKGEKMPSLNWQITLFIGHGKVEGGRAILTTDYSAGSAHAPSYKHGGQSMDAANAIKWECEHGYPASNFSGTPARRPGGKPLSPAFADVLYSLASDADVLDAGGFEEWASNLRIRHGLAQG